MHELTIRPAQATDLAAIVAFNQQMALETEGRELDHATISAGVKGLFESPQYGFYLVACEENKPVGSLLITFEWSDWRNGLLWWVQSVYVQPDWRRRGVYRQLYQHAKKLAMQEENVRGFRLYVEKDNFKAQQTYRQLGMQATDYLLFEEMTGLIAAPM